MLYGLKSIMSQAFALRFYAAEDGAAKIEYALLVFLIGLALIGALQAIGLSIIDIIQAATDGINNNPDS